MGKCNPHETKACCRETKILMSRESDTGQCLIYMTITREKARERERESETVALTSTLCEAEAE